MEKTKEPSPCLVDGRMTRYERSAFLMLVCTEAILSTVGADLEKRLARVPNGMEKLKKAEELVTELERAILPTINKEQRKNLKETLHDYELRPVPKLTPRHTNLVVDKETLKTLVDAAQDGACTSCVKDAKEARNCRLHRTLTVITPMKEYDDGMLCPFNNVGWEN